ncbi:hypothetical protein JANLI_04390 [Janthinobacterium lividum]|nr:hypothetical protein JANLI_04390 [Janthinobacterium lividum]
MRPVRQLLFPRGLLGLHGGVALVARRIAIERLAIQAGQDGFGGRLGVAADADRNLFHQTEHLVVRVDLDDLGVLRPVIHAVLRQGAERAQARAEGHDDVSLGDQFHGRLGTLIAERTAPQRVAGGERVVMQVAIHDRRAQALGQGLAFFDRFAHDDAAARDDHGELGLGQELRRIVEALFAAGAAIQAVRFRDFRLDFAIKIVARDVQLRRAHFRHGAVKAAAREFGHAGRIGDVALVFGEFLEHRQLVRFLETAQAHAHRARLRGNDHDRGMRPVGGGDGGHAITDAGAVLADDHAMAARDAGIAVGHVAGALLVHDGNQTDAGRGKDIHRVHEGRAHDTEHVGYAIGGQGFHERFGRRHLLRAHRYRCGGGFLVGQIGHGSVSLRFYEKSVYFVPIFEIRVQFNGCEMRCQ